MTFNKCQGKICYTYSSYALLLAVNKYSKFCAVSQCLDLSALDCLWMQKDVLANSISLAFAIDRGPVVRQGKLGTNLGLQFPKAPGAENRQQAKPSSGYHHFCAQNA